MNSTMHKYYESKQLKRFKCMIATVLFFAVLSGCVLTPRLFKKNSYTEEITSFFISENKEKIVVLSPKYHYVFDAPGEIIFTLESSFAKNIEARFSEFYVDRDNRIKGAVTLSLNSDASQADREEAWDAGYTGSSQNTSQTINLYGIRYSGVISGEVLIQHEFKKNIPIKIISDHSEAGLAARLVISPVTLAVDGSLVLAGTALFPFALVILPALREILE